MAIEDLLNTQVSVSYPYLVMALILAAILSFILGFLYVKYGKSLSNRKRFASNFMLLTMTTTLIIMVVKSSLALSLGLVGALSIVRFRSAIKEPEELAFLFLCIAIGLGLGAGQVYTTLIAFVIISFFIYVVGIKTKKQENNTNLYLTIKGKVELEEIIIVLESICLEVQLKRVEHIKGGLEALFLIDILDYDDIIEINDKLKKYKVDMTFLDKE